MGCYGMDCGTYNLVSCRRNKDGDFAIKREVNAFVEIPLQDDFIYNMMNTSKIPLIKKEKEKLAYAFGESAVKMAYAMGIELKRPMQDGCVNPKEKSAFQLLNIMMHGLLGEIDSDGAKLYFSVPANAINSETDADYHGAILSSIFKAYKSENGYSVDAHPINEALALTYAEMSHKNYTGLSASFGSGLVNVCFSIFGTPVFQFALANSGDWIDKMSAKACGETPIFINQEKMKVDLINPPVSMVERAIQTQYRLMLEKTISGIKKGLEQNSEKKVKVGHPVDFVIAGGTSLPNGFKELFEEILKSAQLPIEIGEIIRPADPLYSVARGCLIASENSLK